MDEVIASAVFAPLLESTVNSANSVLRLLAAVVAGALIGLERESHAKPAGFRTYIIICVGACLLMILSIYVPQTFREFKNGDPGRIAAQVVTGIGFLGAGAIIRFGLTVKGMTSAASVWAVAAVGMAIGAGFYVGAGVATVILLIVLRWLEILEDKLLGWKLHKKLTIKTVRRPEVFERLQQAIRASEVKILDWSMTEKMDKQTAEYGILIRIRESMDVRKLFTDLGEIDGVNEIRME